MALELQQLRQVLALAEHRSFVRASAALHISQPALSRSIQNLERRFGSDLFLRSAAVSCPPTSAACTSSARATCCAWPTNSTGEAISQRQAAHGAG